jgi:hypothetical protein
MPYRHPSLTPRKRINPYNAERAQRLFERQFHSDEFVKWVQGHGCSIPGCDRGPVEAAHSVSRGAGGTWADVLPLCRSHHREQHDLGVQTFSSKYGIDMAALALETAAVWTHLNPEG